MENRATVKVNFFKQLRQVKDLIERIKNNTNLTQIESYELTVYDNLTEFVASGFVSRSSTAKFISEHWYLPTPVMCKALNSSQGANFTADSLRVQVNLLSNQYCELFPFSVADAFEKGIVKQLDYINSVCNALLNYDTENEIVANTVVASEVVNSVDEYGDTVKRYSLSDCENELRVLKMLSKGNIYGYLDECDKEKLAYLIQNLNSPLLIHKKGERLKTLNTVKLDILTMLGRMENVSLKLDDEISITSSLSEISDSALDFAQNVSQNETETISAENDVVSAESENGSIENDPFVETKESIEKSNKSVSALYYNAVLRPLLLEQIEKNLADSDDIHESASQRCSEWFRLLSSTDLATSVSVLPSEMVVKLVEMLDQSLGEN